MIDWTPLLLTLKLALTTTLLLLSGIVLSLAHTIGEFGVVLMIGGSIPGETRVASIAIYDYVEALDYRSAGTYSLLLLGLSFSMLLIVYLVRNRHLSKIKPG